MYKNLIENHVRGEGRKNRRQVESYALWLLRLADEPPFEKLSPDDKAHVHADLHGFMKMVLDQVPELSISAIKECHTFIRTCVAAQLNGEAYYTRIEMDYCLSLTQDKAMRWVPRGPVNLFKHKILETLSKAKARLRRCRRRGCPNRFLRTGKQEYCSPRCSGKARLLKHRAKNKTVNEPTPH